MATVSDLLRRKGGSVHTVGPDDTVLTAAARMNQNGVGGLVVVDGENRVAGIFTERDILRRVVTEGRDPATTRVSEVMTTEVLACRPETSIEDVAAVMTSKRIRHLPVRGAAGLEGIVTIGDVLAFRVDEQRSTIEYLTSFVYDNR
jgi:CBS domain-containing protein